MKTRLCQIRRIQYKTHILNKIQNNPNFSLSSSIALKNLFTLNAILPPLARLHQALQEKEDEEEEERRKRGEWKHKRAKLLPPGRGKFPRGSLRSLRSLNCAYLCPFASGRPENYYVTCLRRGRGAKRIRRRRRRRRGGRCTRSANAPRALDQPRHNADIQPSPSLPILLTFCQLHAAAPAPSHRPYWSLGALLWSEAKGSAHPFDHPPLLLLLLRSLRRAAEERRRQGSARSTPRVTRLGFLLFLLELDAISSSELDAGTEGDN